MAPTILQELTVKGPYERLKYDLRRVWECPTCHHKERTSGKIINRLCPCQNEVPLAQRVWMKLIEDGARHVTVDPTAPE